MTDYKQLYRSRVVSADEAVRHIQSGNRLFLTGNCSMPQKILEALVKYAPHLHDVEICHALTIGPTEYAKPEMDGHLRVNSLFASAGIRQAIGEGRADFTPVLLSEFPLLFKNKVLPLDVALLHISPPDQHGFCSLGIEAGLSKSAAEASKMIIAEVNPHMPRLLGNTFIHVSNIDYFVEVDYPLQEHKMGQDSDPVVDKMACFIGELIPDGATMQLGIGAIPDAVLPYLKEKKDLGIHSELFSDGVMQLVEAGVITGARKSIHRGKIIAGFVIGTKKLYQWSHDNPRIELLLTEYVNDPFTIAQNERMVAINSAIEIDLTGQVCADSIGPKIYSGVGGQLDFIYGAARSKGGVPIIALPSTTTLRDGTVISRITNMLRQGAGVVTTRNHIRYVVTEYGVADLYGKSFRQRAQQLIAIAHPDFREQLTRQATELHYL